MTEDVGQWKQIADAVDITAASYTPTAWGRQEALVAKAVEMFGPGRYVAPESITFYLRKRERRAMNAAAGLPAPEILPSHVNVRREYDGQIVRTIATSPNRSGFALASKLYELDERNLTVYQSPNGKALQVIEGIHPHGWLVTDDGVVFGHTTESTERALRDLNRRCLRCGHEWYPRSMKTPRICPKCKSPYWDVKKKGRD